MTHTGRSRLERPEIRPPRVRRPLGVGVDDDLWFRRSRPPQKVGPRRVMLKGDADQIENQFPPEATRSTLSPAASVSVAFPLISSLPFPSMTTEFVAPT